jgi:hypothetical protein
MLQTIKEFDQFRTDPTKPDVRGMTVALVDRFNTVVHADPYGLDTNIGIPTSGTSGYLSGANVNDPQRCDLICQTATIYMTMLLRRAIEIFPDSATSSEAVH